MQISFVRITGLAILVFLLIGFSINMTRPNYGQCDFFEKELNGGKKEFGGVEYYAKLCGANIRNGHEVRLQLFDRAGSFYQRTTKRLYVRSARPGRCPNC